MQNQRILQINRRQLIQIQGSLALIASDNTPEHFVAAMGTMVAGFFILNPFFCAELPPIGDGPHDDFFAHSHGESLNMWAGEFIAFMTSGIAFIFCTLPDLALPAMHEKIVGAAAAAPDIVR